MLPTYIYALETTLVPIELPVRYHADIWMTYHERASAIPRVRSLAGWLVEVFSPRLYPWFRDDFIAPQELKKRYRGVPLPQAFDFTLNESVSSKQPIGKTAALSSTY